MLSTLRTYTETVNSNEFSLMMNLKFVIPTVPKAKVIHLQEICSLCVIPPTKDCCNLMGI